MIKKITFFAFFLLFGAKIAVFSQCNCINGAAIGGRTPVSGTTNIGVLQKNNIRALLFYKYGQGSKFFKGDVVQDTGDIKFINYKYIGLSAGYGITNRLSFELETGYYVDKFQDWGIAKYSGDGLSHLLIAAKYNFYYSPAREVEFTAGLGLKIPLQFTVKTLPQHILPSTGEYTGIATLFFHKGYSEKKTHLILMTNTGYNTINGKEYKYGIFNYTSFVATKSFQEKWTAVFELRNEFRDRDIWLKEPVVNSGGWSLNLVPQINYSFGYFNLSLLFDYPIYQNLNGSQIGIDYSTSLNLNWEFSFEKEEKIPDDIDINF